MNRWIGWLGAMAMVLALGGASARGEGERTSFGLPGNASMQLAVPQGWKVTVQRPPRAGLPPLITLSGEAFEVRITPIPQPALNDAAQRDQRLRQVATQLGNRSLPKSKEATLQLEPLKGEKVAGYWWTLSDKSPAAGEFEHMTVCVAAVGDFLVPVTMLHHEKEGAVRQAMLDLIAGATVGEKAETLRVAAPGGAAWDLVLKMPGFNVMEEREGAGGKARQVMAVNAETGQMVSIFLEPAEKEGDSGVVREFYWSKAQQSPLKKERIKLGKAGGFATVEYVVTEAGGQAVNQKNLNVFGAHEGVWIDVHVSKMDFEAKDQKAFDEVPGKVVFEKR